ILDIFSPGYDYPHRIEFFGDQINSIRQFNSSSQKSIVNKESVQIFPSSFILLEKNIIENALKNIKTKASQVGLTSSERDSIINSLSDGMKFDEAEWFISHFYTDRKTLIDYFDDALIVFDGEFDLESAREKLENNFEQREYLPAALKKIMFDFKSYYLSQDELKKTISKKLKIYFNPISKKKNCLKLSSEKTGIEKGSVKSVVKKIIALQKENYYINIFSYSKGEKEKITQILSNYDINEVDHTIGFFSEGFILSDLKIAVITENEITGNKDGKSKNLSNFKDIPSAFITSFSELKTGDYIVHKEFGIGKFNGLKRLGFNGSEGDFIECEYQDRDKIFVPVEKLKLIQRYIGDSKKPSIEKLGTDSWKRTVNRVKKAVESIAKDLLELYARRKTVKGFRFSPRDQIFNEFELLFEFNETEDQSRAIEEVLNDMESDKPMDRLICGDVGFGKTEVALRAAFKAAMDGKQVAFLAPTTLLANQHYQNSAGRLKDYPIEIDMLSRFRSRKEEKEIYKKLEDGTLDIVLGTHKLLSRKISFKNLGLVIIDEEQKFGVKHKEYLRSIKSGVDVLTLSATPIPRTLQLSLTDIRDISLINSPPEGRQAVEVYIQKFDHKVIRNAVLNEIERKGTVFFIHNRI
ncbi:MAG: DEAD/DEAH box helicase, partial [Thermodesulfobacteriota bacterium]